MNKISRYMQNYLLYGFPFVVALILWSVGLAYFSPHTVIAKSNIIIRILNEALSYNLMLWFVVLAIYMVLLVVIPSVREKTLIRLANLKERDEREEYITGKAARAAYIASLSLTLLFLFFSVFSVSLARTPQTDPQKPKHAVMVNLHYSFFSKQEISRTPAEQENIIFDSSQYALSSSTIILILLGWQILVFNLTARKESLKDLA